MERKSTWSRLTLPLRQVVQRISRGLLIWLLSAAFISVLPAQVDDPSDIFLKAYLSAQQGETLEHESRFKAALAKFRFAGSLIEELRKSHADWQPAIVEYRGRKIGEGILRVQERISRHNELAAASSPLPEVVPSLPENEEWSEPGPDVVAPQGLDAISQASDDRAIQDATRTLRRKVDQLQAALEKSRSDLETARKEKEAVNTRLEETSAKLESAQKESATSKESERQARDQLAQTQSSRESSTMEQLRAEITDLKTALAVAEEARATAEKQREEANTKLANANQQIIAVEQQRDEALAQVKAGSETEQHEEALFAENGDLKLMLVNASDNDRAFDQVDSVNAEELAGVQQQLSLLQQQLAESQKRNQYLVARIAELSVQLDDAGSQLQSAKLAGKNIEETDRLMKENELLRNIVVRERQEEARRDEVRKSMLAELDKLEIKSDALNREIKFLAQPVTKLSSEELNLLRRPVVSVSDQSHGGLTATFIFAKKSAPDSAEATGSEANTRSAHEGDATMNNSGPLKDGVRGDPQIAGNPRQGSE